MKWSIAACLWALVAFAPLPAVSQLQDLYLAGNSGVVHTDTAGLIWDVIVPGEESWAFSDVAVHSRLGRVYWVRDWRHLPSSCVNDLWCDGFFSVTVDEDRERVFVGSTGSIHSSDLNLNNRATLSTTAGFVVGMDVDLVHQKLYWATYFSFPGEGRIVRADILNDGLLLSEPEVIFSAPIVLSDVKVDAGGGKVYWADPTNHRLQRASLDGTNIETLAVTNWVVGALALDPLRQTLYWLENPERETVLMKAGLDGSNPVQLWRKQYQDYTSMVLGPEGQVRLERKGWSKFKEMYR